MKIRFAVLAAMILASASACIQSPTATDHSRGSAPVLRADETADTTTRNGGTFGTGH
jgi:hypothetical protein